MKAPEHEHLVHETITISVYYPDHAPRTESAIFAATKRYWHKAGARCLVCGTDQKVEIHHRFVEWADAEGTNVAKLKAWHPDFDWSNFKTMADFVDSVYNTEPLCELHHRGPAPHGKHFTPEPIWNMQKYMRDDFVYCPDEVTP